MNGQALKPGRRTRAAMGLLSLWSPLFVAGFALWLWRSAAVTAPARLALLSEEELWRLVGELAILAILNGATLVALTVTTLYFEVHILKNPVLSERRKVLWSLLNVTVGVFVMPAYWFLHVRGGKADP
ncbi:MAG: hypothetical protein AB1347_07480 [Acidobacteriota bacterium]